MTEWMLDAKCRRKRQEFWFPPVDAPNLSQFYNIGRLVCERCPVWRECLDIGKDEQIGMWGGLIPKERLLIRGKPATVRNHGTISRYRQGCTCEDCTKAANKVLPSIDMSYIPDNDQPLELDLVKKYVQDTFGSAR